MPTTRKTFNGAALSTTLVNDVTPASPGPGDTLAGVDLTGWPATVGRSFVGAVGMGTEVEEKILFSARSGNTLTVEQRGYDGTTPTNHFAGDTLDHVVDAGTIQAHEDHPHDTVGHTAAQITATAHGGIDSLTVQAQLEQIEAQKADQVDVPLAVPTGTVLPYGGVAAPNGYLLAQGQNVSRTTYAGLFAVYGTRYGQGDGSTTFTLPDLRDRFPSGAGTDRPLAAKGGAATATLTSANLAPHTHTGPNHAHLMGDHTHGSGTLTTSTAGSHTHDSNGTSQQYVVPTGSSTLYAAGSGPYPVTGSMHDPAGEHQHNINGSTGAGGSPATNSAGTGATGSTGSGTPFSIVPPYLGLHFIVKT